MMNASEDRIDETVKRLKFDDECDTTLREEYSLLSAPPTTNSFVRYTDTFNDDDDEIYDEACNETDDDKKKRVVACCVPMSSRENFLARRARAFCDRLFREKTPEETKADEEWEDEFDDELTKDEDVYGELERKYRYTKMWRTFWKNGGLEEFVCRRERSWMKDESERVLKIGGLLCSNNNKTTTIHVMPENNT